MGTKTPPSRLFLGIDRKVGCYQIKGESFQDIEVDWLYTLLLLLIIIIILLNILLGFAIAESG